MTKKSPCRSRVRGRWKVGAATDEDVFVEANGDPALLQLVEPELVEGPPGLFSDAFTDTTSRFNAGIVGSSKSIIHSQLIRCSVRVGSASYRIQPD